MAAIRTNLILDSVKLDRAKRLTGLKTTRAVVDFALRRLTSTTKAFSKLLGLVGTIHFTKGYSYKKARG